jgi:hypothetical protein
MADLIERMATNAVLIYAFCCAIFIYLAWSSLAKAQIDLGSIPPKIRKSEQPGLLWAFVCSYGGIAFWAGLAALKSVS